MPGGHPGQHWVCSLRGREVAAIVSPHGAPPPPAPAWTTHVQVDDADAAAARAEAAGGAVVGPPFDSPGGGRVAVLADPGGAVFCVWQPAERRGAQLVNEPGAWSMSLLRAPDAGAAAAFYGELFGWQVEPFAEGLALFRLPGFVGGEPEQPVPRDVVAVMAPADEAPPRWDVDFWVFDADATAARAAELGGSVAASPHDAPPFRQAVLADPAGATFSVSALVAQPR
jgi:predicted enzyme related to lactoylglutathione lyase